MISGNMSHWIWVADVTLSPEAVGGILAFFVVGLLGAGVLGKKGAETQRIKVESPGIEVTLRDKFLTRSEFLEFKGEIKSDVREMRVLYDKALSLIVDRDLRTASDMKELGEALHKRISDADEAGAERRRRIHDKLNDHSDKLTAIETRTEVSKSIGRLGGAIMALAKKEPN